MQIKIGGWKKIYLFYGVVFFSLGLFGFLFNSRLALSEIAEFIMDDFPEELVEVGIVRSRKIPVVTVSNDRLSPTFLISRNDNSSSEYRVMVERIYRRMAQKVQVVHYSASGADWLNTPEIVSLMNENRFIIGVENSDRMAAHGFSIIFSVSKPMIVNFFERLVNQNPGLPLFELGQINSPSNSIYRFRYLKPSVSDTHLMKVIDTLLETWETMEHQKVDGAFPF
jgi:hypothetical protein